MEVQKRVRFWGKDHEFKFGRVGFEISMEHRIRNVCYAQGDVGLQLRRESKLDV